MESSPNHQLMVKAQTVFLLLGSHFFLELDPLLHAFRDLLASHIYPRLHLDSGSSLVQCHQVTAMVKTSRVHPLKHAEPGAAQTKH